MFTPEAAKGTHLKFYVGAHNGRVVVDFGRSITHMEMEPAEAEKIAELLIKHAGRARVPDVSKPDPV